MTALRTSMPVYLKPEGKALISSLAVKLGITRTEACRLLMINGIKHMKKEGTWPL